MPLRIIDYGHEFHISWEFDHWHKRNLAAVKDLHVLDIYQQKQPVAKYIVTEKRKYWKAPAHDPVRKQVEQLKYSHHAEIVLPAELRPEMTGEVEPLPDLNIDLPITAELRPYQKNGIAGMMKFRKCMNGDEQGLGKTIQSLSAAIGIGEFPGMVIAPAATIYNWQNEWHKFSHKKALVLDPQKLSDTQRKNWFKYIQTGEYDVAVVSYQSFVSFCVESFPQGKGKNGKKKRWTAKDVILKPFMEMFKFGILDESHRCFPYETKVLTNKGWLDIGKIVENDLTDLYVLSADFSTGELTYKPIKNVWRNDLGERKLYRVTTNNGTFYSTENHKIYTTSGRKKEVHEIKSGEELFMLRQEFLYNEGRQNDSDILFEKLCTENKQFETGCAFEDGQKQEKALVSKGMCMVRRNISDDKQRKEKGQEVLFTELFVQMEGEVARNDSYQSVGIEAGSHTNSNYQTNGESCIAPNAFAENEAAKPYGQFSDRGKDESKNAGENFSIKRRQRPTDCTSEGALPGTTPARGDDGICHINKTGEGDVSIATNKLQGGYSSARNQTCDRSGWAFASNQEVEVFRQAQNRNIECVRVESVEIYEPRGIDEYGYGSFNNKTVYDIEVADNHNYFADGFLVSNCKDPNTNQSKFILRFFVTLHNRFLLTGTPVVNKPKDIWPQLAIMGTLNSVFGGKKPFLDRYCEGGNGANNLKELNYMLNKHCFFRREKKDVAKDLPEKMRQTIVCDITTRADYHKAEKDMETWLESVGFDGQQISKKMQAEALIRLGVLRQISARGKLKEVAEFIEEVMDAGEKLVVFCNLYEIVDSLRHEFPKAVTVTGRDSSSQKQSNIEKFQKDPECQLIICNIKAAGVGITLTASSRVAFVEYPWTYADCVQCEDRCHRIGQVNNVMCTYFNGKDTVDEKLYNIIQEKRHIGNTITGASDQMEFEVVNKMLNLFSGMKKQIDEEEFENIKD